jgi:hypothetical protein
MGARRVHVVTRNAHTDDIRAYLCARGLHSVRVHRVARPRSKAEIVCDRSLWEPCGRRHEPPSAERPAGAERPASADADPQASAGAIATHRGGRPSVLFVDDTLSEHLDPEVRGAEHVVRFLFARSR